MDYSVISIFSGAMGLDLGLQRAGLRVAVATDFDKDCCETIRSNGHRVVPGDITQLLDRDPDCGFLLRPANLKRREAFAVVGGPPCQSFSYLGKRRGVDDERGRLLFSFPQVVSAVRPRFFVLENVAALARQASTMHELLKRFAELGYNTEHGVVNAVNYGVAQRRERLLIIGSRDGERVHLPSPNASTRTLRDVIGTVTGGLCARFRPQIEQIMPLVPEGKNWKSLSPEIADEVMGGANRKAGGLTGYFRRLAWDKPSPTLTCSPTQKANLLCHPVENRPLSINEYAAIQGFPKDWKFAGDMNSVYAQIGNAVPIGLGEAIGRSLLEAAQ